MKRIMTVLMGALMVLTLGACGLASNEANQIGLQYGGGVVENKEFKGVIPPGATNDTIGPGDSVYNYPIDQRSFIVGGHGDENGNADDAIQVVSSPDSGSVRMNVPVQVYFTLNQKTETLVRFHENIGLKTHAYFDGDSSEGWDKMLRNYFRPQMERALQSAASGYAMAALRNNEETRAEFQQKAADEFTRLLPVAIGGDYFCGPQYTGKNECGEVSFTVQKPEPVNKDVAESLEQVQINEQRRLAQVAENLRIEEQLKAQQNQVVTLGQEGYARLREAEIWAEVCREKPDACPSVVISGSGTNTSVPAK